MALMLLSPCGAFAESEAAAGFDAPDAAGLTKVTVVDSVEELARESSAADNEAFFTIDASKKSTNEALATDEVQASVDDILSGGKSASEKQGEIIDTLEESGLYRAEEGSGSKVEVTSRYACCRLRLTADKEKEINAYGAVNAVYYDGYYLLSYESEEATRLACEALKQEYGSKAVLRDIPIQIDSLGWGTKYMGMDIEKEKQEAKTGGDVVVAVCDTGVYQEHNIFSATNFTAPFNARNGSSDASDDNGHGTGVAGIIAESTPPSRVSIMPIKVLGADGKGSLIDLFKGVKHAEENGADIINLSLGAVLHRDDPEDAEDLAALEAYDEEFASYSAMIVSASGNEYTDMDGEGVVEVPGELESSICVGAIDREGKRCGFSNYGDAIDFAAPGQSIGRADIGSVNKYKTSNGTSFAAPYISAFASILKAENPEADKNVLYNSMKYLSTDLGVEGRDREFGHGCPIFEDAEEIIRGGEILQDGITVSGVTDKTYTGSARTQDLSVWLYWIKLEEGRDYRVEYINNVNVGRADIRIYGIGDFEGVLEGIHFNILPRFAEPRVVLSSESFRYTGRQEAPEVSVFDGNKKLEEGSDYDVTLSPGRVMPGHYYANVSLKGNYRGFGSATFDIKKLSNGLAVKTRAAKVKRSVLKKKAQTLPVSKVLGVSGADGTLRFKKMSGSSRLKINSKSGKVTVKKKTKKGKYKMKVKVSAAGDATHSSASRTVTLTVKVK